MTAGRLMIFDEHVLSKHNGMRRLRTIKAPLFDEDNDIMGTVGVAMDVTQEYEYKQQILALTRHDPLTGLANRRYFYEYVKEHSNEPKFLLEFDIDNYKHFNDCFGHQAGDEVLQFFAKTLENNFRFAFPVRFGGDEFIVLYAGNHTPEEVQEATASFQQALREQSLLMPTGEIRTSIGVAFDADGSVPIDQLYHRADLALYYAKERGKNCVAVWNESMLDNQDKCEVNLPKK